MPIRLGHQHDHASPLELNTIVISWIEASTRLQTQLDFTPNRHYQPWLPSPTNGDTNTPLTHQRPLREQTPTPAAEDPPKRCLQREKWRRQTSSSLLRQEHGFRQEGIPPAGRIDDMPTPPRRSVAPKGVTVARLSPAAILARPDNEAARREEEAIAVNHTPTASLTCICTAGKATPPRRGM